MNKYFKIICHYGIEKQQRKLAEEQFELQQAISNYEQLKAVAETDSDLMIKKYENIEEEIADNLVLITQFINFYGIDKEVLERIVKEKVDRTITNIVENIE